MYYFIASLKQTVKLFAISAICSVLFVRFYDATYSKPLMGFILLLASMLLFAFLCDRSFFGLYNNSEGFIDYLIPAGISYAVYTIMAFTLYSFDLRAVYNYLFLPTRFLAPLYPTNLSYALSYLIILLVVLRIPIAQHYYLKFDSDEAVRDTMPARFLDGLGVVTHTAGNILNYTLLLFINSILCSALFFNILISVQKKPLVFVALITASLLLFLFICDKLFFYLCKNTRSTLEYLIPSLCAFALYITAASTLYYYELSDIYNMVFLPTRFIEPMYQLLARNQLISIASYVISYILLFAVIIRIPIERYIFVKRLEYDEELREEENGSLEDQY